MTVQHEGDALYALGHSEEERQRLTEQDKNYGPITTRFLIEAGVGPGMRVLDVGCGVGDVSFRTAELVGPEGAVIGVDADLAAVDTARQRAMAGGFGTVAFQQGDLRQLAFDEPFDAVVGRLILVYLGDPVGAVRHLAGLVRPGGILTFHELAMGFMPPHFPGLPLVERSFGWVFETFRRAGMDLDVALKLYGVFEDAGLPNPTVEAATLTMAGPHSPLYEYLASTVRSALPIMTRLGVATAEEVDIDTLAQRLRSEVVESRGVFLCPPQVGVWARKPNG